MKKNFTLISIENISRNVTTWCYEYDKNRYYDFKFNTSRLNFCYLQNNINAFLADSLPLALLWKYQTIFQYLHGPRIGGGGVKESEKETVKRDTHSYKDIRDGIISKIISRYFISFSFLFWRNLIESSRLFSTIVLCCVYFTIISFWIVKFQPHTHAICLH